MMDKKIKARWIKALLSGKYKQGRSVLLKNEGGEKLYCCLGVLCDLAVKSRAIPPPEDRKVVFLFDGEDGELPSLVVEWAKLEDSNPIVKATPFKDSKDCSLANLNDKGRTFKQIAGYIEKSL